MYKKTILILFILFICTSCTQKKLEPIDFHDSFIDYERISNKEKYLDSLFYRTVKMANDSLVREQLLKIAARYDWLNNDIKFRKTIKLISQLAATQKDTSHQAKSLWYWGDYYDSRQISDSAYYKYIKAEKLYSTLNDKINQARMLLYKAVILYNNDIYTESEALLAQVLQILATTNKTRLKFEANNLMALTLDGLKEYQPSNKYYKETHSLLLQLEREGYEDDQLQLSWLTYYNNRGRYYNEINNPKEAENHFKIALKNKFIDSFPRSKAMLLNNYAHSQILIGGNEILIDSLLDTSLEIREKIDHKRGIIATKIRKADFKLIKQDTINAVKTMHEAYQMALNDKSGYELIESLKFLSEHDKKNKVFYTKIHLKTQDSLQNIERQTRNKFARIAYETDQIERKNDILVKKNIYLLVLISTVLILSVSIFIALQLQSKNKKLKQEKREQNAIQQIQELLLKQQVLTSEVKNQERLRIAKDLHDAIVNRVFTTRINLEELPSSNVSLKSKLINQLKQTEAQIRTIAHDIHNNLFDQKEDFTAILKDLVLSQKNSFQTAFECPNDVSVDWSSFSIQQKTQVYLILQELLQNVNKHSQAARCFAYFLNDENKITIRIHDNGIGLNKDKVSTGMGINNIKHRLKELNGKIEFSEIRGWTVVSVTFEIE